MIVTRSWLKEFVDFDFTAEDLSHRLTMAGLEVDAMDKLGEGLDGVIVARLISVEHHPDADRLTVCQVDTGADSVQVVCGARNHRAGNLVALAQVGTVLPGDFKIKKSKIRGQVSQGMLCSEKELGLAEEADGILILPDGLAPGRPLFEALGLKDVRYELGLTPNRPDCLSILGVAREVAAMAGEPVSVPSTNLLEDGPSIEELTSVVVEEPDLCPRYAARMIRGVKIGPSPTWLVRRLESVGMRSINNVVDVTNFILMELGHPLHAFDFNLLRGRRIIVRRAAVEGEDFVTLDSQKRQIGHDDLVICDAQGPVALAGIMGGENSEVQADTVDILLESAYFNPTTIRRTGRRLGIHTESSHRFERGADVNMVPVALNRAAALIQQVAGGSVAKGMIDIYPRAVAERKLTITTRRTNEILGLKLETLVILRLLRSIGLAVEPAGDRADEALYISVPTFRPDLEREIDLIEEVARLNGYDRIPSTMPAGRAICHRPTRRQKLAAMARDVMVQAGLSEVVNYSFISTGAWDRICLAADDDRRRCVPILNPLTEEQAVMRTSLVPSLLETAARNLAYRSRDLALFELRPTFRPLEGEALSHEGLRLTGLRCGRREPEGWAQDQQQVDFYDLKGIVENLFASLRVTEIVWDGESSEPFLHPGKSCTLRRGERVLGVMGEIHPRVLENYDIDQPLFLFDLDFEAIVAVAGDFIGFKPLSRYPDVYRDSAFLLDEAISARQVFDVLAEAKGKYVEDVTLFDLYRGKGVPEGKKSLAIRIRYRSTDRTLTDEEINSVHGRLIKVLGEKLGAEQR